MKSNIGKIVRCIFWDHTASNMGEEGIVKVQAFGCIVKEDERYIVIKSWQNITDNGAWDDECYSIMRGAIEELVELKDNKKIVKKHNK